MTILPYHLLVILEWQCFVSILEATGGAIFGAYQFTGGFQLAYLLPVHAISANRILKVIVVIKLSKKTIYKDLFLLILRLCRRVDFKPLCLNHLVDGILSLQIRAVSLYEPESNGDHQHHSKHGDRIIHIAR